MSYSNRPYGYEDRSKPKLQTRETYEYWEDVRGFVHYTDPKRYFQGKGNATGAIILKHKLLEKSKEEERKAALETSE
jgi:hypothetical protein